MTAAEWVSVAMGCAALAASGAAWFTLYGRFQQEVKDLKEKVVDHEERITALQRAVEGIRVSTDRVLEKIDGQKAIFAGELGRLGDQVRAGQELLTAKLDLGDRLAARELEQLKFDLRGVTQRIEDLPHPRRRSTTERS